MDKKELESAIRTTMATAFIENLPEETRREILVASIERTFEDICSSYSMKVSIEAKLQAYMDVYVDEYLKDPKVQDRLKTMAHEAVDTVHEAVLVSIIAGVQRHMKSDYFNFVKEMQEGK